MRLRSYIILAVLVTALGGLALGALFFDRQQQFDQEHIESAKRTQQLNDAQRLVDQVNQLLISVDLLFGAQETYMIVPSARQAQLAMNFSSTVYDSLRNIDHPEKTWLLEIQKYLNTLIQETDNVQFKAGGSTLIISNQQLNRVDTAAQGLLDNVSALQTLFKESFQIHQDQSRSSRPQYDSIINIGVAAYFTSIVAVLWWASRSVSKPMALLTRSARTALEDKSSFQPLVHGPTEVHTLNDKHQAESRLRHMANHDSLTGLLNRRAFKECLEQHFESDFTNSCALLYLDVDQFKTINDTLGHDIGDSTLQHVSKCLADCLRSVDSLASMHSTYDDVAARVGGDEFVALLPGVTDSEVAKLIALRLQRALDRPFFYQDQQIEVTVSIGVALYPQDGHDSDTLLKSADLAMFKAKHMGGNEVFVYESKMGEQSRKKTTLKAKFRRALNSNDLFLVYQPKIDLSSGLIVGAEALIRWQDGDSIMSPNDFIPLAEETGLILPLGEFVIDSALQQIAQWRDNGITLDHVAINVSAAQLKKAGFFSSILAAADRAKVNPSMLNLEITESLLIGQYSSSLVVLNELRAAGFTIALDDFGTGYSSLSYIKNLPLDILKIDRSFVSGISESKTERAIIKSIIEMGQTLGLRLVAEGVESAEQAKFLQSCDCNEVQGYLYSPPVSAEEFQRLFNEQAAQRLRVIR